MFERSHRKKLRRSSNALLLSPRTTNRGKVTQLWKSLTNDEFALNIGIIVGTESGVCCPPPPHTPLSRLLRREPDDLSLSQRTSTGRRTLSSVLLEPSARFSSTCSNGVIGRSCEGPRMHCF